MSEIEYPHRALRLVPKNRIRYVGTFRDDEGTLQAVWQDPDTGFVGYRTNHSSYHDFDVLVECNADDLRTCRLRFSLGR